MFSDKLVILKPHDEGANSFQSDSLDAECYFSLSSSSFFTTTLLAQLQEKLRIFLEGIEHYDFISRESFEGKRLSLENPLHPSA